MDAILARETGITQVKEYRFRTKQRAFSCLAVLFLVVVGLLKLLQDGHTSETRTLCGGTLVFAKTNQQQFSQFEIDSRQGDNDQTKTCLRVQPTDQAQREAFHSLTVGGVGPYCVHSSRESKLGDQTTEVSVVTGDYCYRGLFVEQDDTHTSLSSTTGVDGSSSTSTVHQVRGAHFQALLYVRLFLSLTGEWYMGAQSWSPTQPAHSTPPPRNKINVDNDDNAASDNAKTIPRFESTTAWFLPSACDLSTAASPYSCMDKDTAQPWNGEEDDLFSTSSGESDPWPQNFRRMALNVTECDYFEECLVTRDTTYKPLLEVSFTLGSLSLVTLGAVLLPFFQPQRVSYPVLATILVAGITAGGGSQIVLACPSMLQVHLIAQIMGLVSSLMILMIMGVWSKHHEFRSWDHEPANPGACVPPMSKLPTTDASTKPHLSSLDGPSMDEKHQGTQRGDLRAGPGPVPVGLQDGDSIVLVSRKLRVHILASVIRQYHLLHVCLIGGLVVVLYVLFVLMQERFPRTPPNWQQEVDSISSPMTTCDLWFERNLLFWSSACVPGFSSFLQNSFGGGSTLYDRLLQKITVAKLRENVAREMLSADRLKTP